jgi:hypothetical protein
MLNQTLWLSLCLAELQLRYVKKFDRLEPGRNGKPFLLRGKWYPEPGNQSILQAGIKAKLV